MTEQSEKFSSISLIEEYFHNFSKFQYEKAKSFIVFQQSTSFPMFSNYSK